MIKKRILITGGFGKFGSLLSEVLFFADFEPCLIDNKTETYESVPVFGTIAELDLLDTESVAELMIREKFAAVIHAAHLHDEADSFKNPDLYYQNNFGGTLSLLKAMQTAKMMNLIAIGHATEQDSPLRRSYQMSLQAIQDASKAYGMQISIMTKEDPAEFVQKLRNLLK